MAVLYSFEKGKFGGQTGFIYVYSKTMSSSDPDDSSNNDTIPAGYLKCDGTIYQASLFPGLAGILGTGSTCKYKGSATLSSNQFRVPDLGAKVIRGSQNNIGEVLYAEIENASGNTVSKAGVGATITNNTEGSVEIEFGGSFKVPPLSIDMVGNPGWTNDKTTTTEGVTAQQMQPHAHYSSTIRSREADDTTVTTFTYKNSKETNYCGTDFDTNLQKSIVIAVRNIDVVTADGGDDAGTEHSHSITRTAGIFHSSEPTGYFHDYKCNMGQNVSFTGNITNGSSSITSVSSTTGLSTGLPISPTSIGVRVPGNTTISSISGSTITLSNAINTTDGTSSKSSVSFKATAAQTILPDGLVAKVNVTASSAAKFDDVSSPFILVQYLIKI